MLAPCRGECGTDGQCVCTPGFTRADDGTACAKCAAGFFLTSSGDCKGKSWIRLVVLVDGISDLT